MRERPFDEVDWPEGTMNQDYFFDYPLNEAMGNIYCPFCRAVVSLISLHLKLDSKVQDPNLILRIDRERFGTLYQDSATDLAGIEETETGTPGLWDRVKANKGDTDDLGKNKVVRCECGDGKNGDSAHQTLALLKETLLSETSMDHMCSTLSSARDTHGGEGSGHEAAPSPQEQRLVAERCRVSIKMVDMGQPSRTWTSAWWGLQIVGHPGVDRHAVLGLGRTTFGPTLDLSLVSQWLERCSSEHGTKCGAMAAGTVTTAAADERPGDDDFHVIDVEQRRVVKAPPACTYFALSYTWGPKGTPQLEFRCHTWERLFSRGGLADSHSDIPTTIRDAMNFTQAMKMQYLWVDALCIQQDDASNVQANVAQMDLIYGRSALTIVAARGGQKSDSWTGLGRLAEKEKDHTGRVAAAVQGIQLCGTRMTYSTALKGAAWNTRAWTFQEHILSPRSLIFGFDQVYYQCNESTWWEDTILEPEPNWRLSSTSGNNLKMGCVGCQQDTPSVLLPKYRQVTVAAGYLDLLTDFTARDLTYDSDVIKAFTGIMKAYSKCEGWAFLWGLPLQFFENVLLFEMPLHEPQLRRHQYPSWSWAGWNHFKIGRPVCFNDGNCTNFHVDAEVEWHTVQEDGKGYRKLQTTTPGHCEAAEGRWPERSLWRSQATGHLADLPPAQDNVILDHLLVFRASYVQAALDSAPTEERQHPLLSSLKGRDHAQDEQSPLYAIRSKTTGEFLGSVRLNTEWRDGRGGLIELIVVGRGPDTTDIVANEGRVGVMVMAIETDSAGYSERVQILSREVSDKDWADLLPEWKTIFLK